MNYDHDGMKLAVQSNEDEDIVLSKVYLCWATLPDWPLFEEVEKGCLASFDKN